MSAPTAIIVASSCMLCVAIVVAMLRHHARSRAMQEADELRAVHEQKIRETTRQMSESGRLLMNEFSTADQKGADKDQGDQSFEAQFASLPETVEPVDTEAEWTSQDLDLDHALSVDDTRY